MIITNLRNYQREQVFKKSKSSEKFLQQSNNLNF